jgi:putative transposase
VAFAADSTGGSHAGLAGLTLAQRDQALARWQVLRVHLEDDCPLVRVAGEHGVPERTLRRWLAVYRTGGLAALARRPRSDRGTRRMPPDLQLLIEGLALRRPPPTIATVHRQAAEVAREQGWAVPGYAAVYDVVRSIDPALATLAHEGSKRYKEVFDLVHRREAAKPNQIWQADHTLLDLWVLTPSGGPGRPWLTLIEDDHSRAVAGYAVNLDAPSALTTSLAFRQAIWRKPWPGWHVCGIPDAFHVDHGSDFTSAHLEQVMADLKIRAYFSLPGQPRGRGKVERIFGTINQMCLPSLPGYAPRGTPDRAGQARLTLAELDAAIGLFVREVYNLTPHSETGMAPQQRWEAGAFIPQMPDSLEQLDLLLLTVAKPRKIHPDGIHFQGLRYLDPVLVLRSLKGVYKASAVGAWLGLGPSPDPGPGAGVELGGGDPGGVGDLVGVGEVLPGQGLAPEDPPPAFLQVQPAGALGDEGVPDAGMAVEPGPGALAVVAGEVVGDHPDGALGIGLLGLLEEVLVGDAVAGRRAHGDRLAIPDAQPAVDPGLLRPAGVLQRRLDPVPAG